jgi:UDP-N-acetylglucosamine 2-epimerase (non-hydrolysing)
MLEKFNLKVPGCVKTIPLLGYLEFLQLQKNSHLIMTDSGGMQEESCVLKVPCVTLRDNTERPETLNVGSNILVGVEPESVLNGTKEMTKKDRSWTNPYGDGKTAERIISILQQKL